MCCVERLMDADTSLNRCEAISFLNHSLFSYSTLQLLYCFWCADCNILRFFCCLLAVGLRFFFLDCFHQRFSSDLLLLVRFQVSYKCVWCFRPSARSSSTGSMLASWA